VSQRDSDFDAGEGAARGGGFGRKKEKKHQLEKNSAKKKKAVKKDKSATKAGNHMKGSGGHRTANCKKGREEKDRKREKS